MQVRYKYNKGIKIYNSETSLFLVYLFYLQVFLLKNIYFIPRCVYEISFYIHSSKMNNSAGLIMIRSLL